MDVAPHCVLLVLLTNRYCVVDVLTICCVLPTTDVAAIGMGSNQTGGRYGFEGGRLTAVDSHSRGSA